MTRKYRKWTAEELKAIRDYIDSTENPHSLYHLSEFAEIMGVSRDALRGVVVREVKRRNDLRKK